MVEIVVQVCSRQRLRTAMSVVTLSSGVFLNALLLCEVIERLERDGFWVIRYRWVLPSDGGLSFGPLAVAAAGRRPASPGSRGMPDRNEESPMYLGILGKMVATSREHGVRIGTVEFSGISERVCLEPISETCVDDHVLVHVGFCLFRIDEDAARRVFAFLESMSQLDEPGPRDGVERGPEEIRAGSDGDRSPDPVPSDSCSTSV